MSDDFEKDLQAAVDNGGKATEEPDVTNTVTDGEQQQQVTPTAPDETEAKVLEILGDSEYEAEEKAAKEAEEQAAQEEKKKKEEEEKAAQQQEKEQQETTAADAEKPQRGKGKPFIPYKESTPYLDRYLKEDKEGNLISLKGNVIAAKGEARNFYEKIKAEGRQHREAATNLAIQNQQLGTEFKKLYDEYQKLSDGSSSTASLAKSTGMTETEVSSAIDLMKQYKTDPLTAIKSLLTQAQMNGIDLKQLGVNGGIDPATVHKAVTSAIQEHIAPVAKTSQEQARMQEIQQEITSFWNEFPDLKDHEATIAEAKKRRPDMSLREIGLRYRQWLMNNPPEQEQEQTQQVVDQDHQQQVAERRVVNRPAANKKPPVTNSVTPPKQRDYSRMSFAEIAQSIVEETPQ